MDRTQLRSAVLMCHAPIVIPAVGGTEAPRCRATTEAMGEAAGLLAACGAARVVVLSPHAPRHRRAYGHFQPARLQGNLARFGHPDLALAFPNDPEALAVIRTSTQREGLTFEALPERELDHGATVPLWFLQEAGFPGRVLVLAFPWEAGEGSHHRFGHALARAMEDLGESWALLASGDMSHALRPGGPGGFHPKAHAFDQLVVDCVARGCPEDAARIPAELRGIAAEDVVESLEVSAGILGPGPRPAQVLSYEAPFGVGYLEAVLLDRPAAS